MTQAYNLSQLANFVNTSGQLDATLGLTNTSSIGFPSGTRMSFNQTSAPTGWTKQTATAINDSLLRLVTGSVSNGGSTDFSTWNASAVTGATTLSTSQLPGHNHPMTVNLGNKGGVTTQFGTSSTGPTDTTSFSTGSAGSGASHTHTTTNNIKYYDFIIAQKD